MNGSGRLTARIIQEQLRGHAGHTRGRKARDETGRRSQHHLLGEECRQPGQEYGRVLLMPGTPQLRPSAALLVGSGSGRGRLANRPHERTQRFRRPVHGDSGPQSGD